MGCLALSQPAFAADAGSDQQKPIDYAAVAERLRHGAPMSNDIWQLLDKDEDRSIPMLLEVFESPGQAPRSSISFALTQLDDGYHKSKVSSKNRDLIIERADRLLSSTDVDIRAGALTTLWTYKSASSIEPLKTFIHSSAPSFQRAQATLILVRQLQTPDEIASQMQFFQELRGNPDFAVSSAAHFVLADTYKDPDEIRAQARDRNTPYGSIDSAITALQSGNQWQVGKAAAELVRDGVDSMPGLITTIRDTESDTVRSAAYGALRGIVSRKKNRTPAAFQSLQGCQRSGNDRAVRHCVELLPKFDTPEAHAAIVECALTLDGYVRDVCLQQIRPPWGRSEAGRLHKLLDNKEFNARSLLIFVLADNDDASGLQEARTLLAKIIEEQPLKETPESRRDRVDADLLIDALGYIGDDSDLALLKKFGDPNRRWNPSTKNAIETVARDIALRKQGDAAAQIKFLKKQFKIQPDNWTVSWLIRLMGDRKAAEFLLPFAHVTAGAQPDPASQIAFQWLLGSGWIDEEQALRDPQHLKLLDQATSPEQ